MMKVDFNHGTKRRFGGGPALIPGGFMGAR